VSVETERNRTYRHRKAQLEAVRAELRTMTRLIRQPFVRAQIPQADVRDWLDHLLELAEENEA
jgi:hypothetical protein